MKGYHLFLLAGLLTGLLAASGAAAQDTHYWTLQYGSRSALLGGAVVGGSKDNTSIEYNPGSLGFIDTGAISIDATLYQLQNIRVRNAVGQKADFRSSSLGSIPLLLSGIFKTKNPNWKMGFGVVHPVDFDFKATARLDGNYPIVNTPESPGDEAFIGQESISSSVSEIMFAFGIARRLNKHWSIGLSNFFTARSQSYIRAQLARLFLNDADTTLVASTLLQNFSYFHLRYSAKIGIAYEGDHLSAGLAFTTPGLKLAGSGTVAEDLTASNIQVDGQPRANVLADDRQPKLPTVFHAPFHVSGGVNISLHHSLLAATAEYFGAEAIYDNLRASAAAFVRPAGVYPQLTSDQFLRVKTGARSVTNVAVGYEYYAKPDLTLYASFRTNMSYYDKDLVNETGIKPDITTWNIYHMTLGASFRFGKSSVSTGLIYATGNDAKHPQEGNLSTPSEDNFLQGSTTVTQASYSSIGILVGYTYNFQKH